MKNNNKLTITAIILNCCAFVFTAVAAILQIILHNSFGIFFTVILIALSVLNFVLGVLNIYKLKKGKVYENINKKTNN